MKINETSKDVKDFNMYASNAYSTYTQNNVGIESPVKLIEMLYEGVLRFNAQAKKATKDGNLEKRAYWTNRSVSIIVELASVLDMEQGDVSSYLSGLYDYQIQLLISANIENSIEKLDECSNVFKTLLTAWRETTDVA
jgi:flagellar protein FliS